MKEGKNTGAEPSHPRGSSPSCLNARTFHWFLSTCLLGVLKILLPCMFWRSHAFFSANFCHILVPIFACLVHLNLVFDYRPIVYCLCTRTDTCLFWPLGLWFKIFSPLADHLSSSLSRSTLGCGRCGTGLSSPRKRVHARTATHYGLEAQPRGRLGVVSLVRVLDSSPSGRSVLEVTQRRLVLSGSRLPRPSQFFARVLHW